MLLLTGVLIIIAGIFIGAKMYRKAEFEAREAMGRLPVYQSMEELLQGLPAAGSRRKEAVRVEGPLYSDQTVKAPLSGLEAAYYESRAAALFKGGIEKPVFEEAAKAPVYLWDEKSGQRIYLEIGSFGSGAELMPAKLETAAPDAPNYEALRDSLGYTPEDPELFRGLRVLEGYVPQGQTLYVKGNLVREKNTWWLRPTAKEPFLSYRIKSRQVKPPFHEKMTAIGSGVVLVAVGILLIVMHFTTG